MKTKFLNIFRYVFKIPILENWLRKKVQGKEATNFLAKLVPSNYQYKKNSIRKFKYKGINLELDIHDYVSHYLYFGFKDLAHEKLMGLVNKNNTVLDIGTNYGTTLLQFAKKVGEKGLVFGFEPDPINYEICTKNIVLNSFFNVEVDNLGLGDVLGELLLVVDTESNRGGNRISKNTFGKEAYKVKIVSLDEWIENKNVQHIDLIKMDVEGFEYNVLKGAEKTLEKFRPILFIELDDENLKLQDASAELLVKFLIEKNYVITNSENNESISEKSNFNYCHYDIIAK